MGKMPLSWTAPYLSRPEDISQRVAAEETSIGLDRSLCKLQSYLGSGTDFVRWERRTVHLVWGSRHGDASAPEVVTCAFPISSYNSRVSVSSAPSCLMVSSMSKPVGS